MKTPKSRKRVAILARTDDPNLEFVTRFLTDEPVAIDIGRMVEHGLSYTFGIKDPWPVITLDGKQVDIGPDAIKSVWYRNVDYKHMGPKLPIGPEYDFLKESSLASLTRMGQAMGQFFRPGVLWVSKRDAIQRAELKPYQLVQARLAGFNIPETLYTTAPDKALRFVRERGICIVKPLAPYPPEGRGQPTRLLRYDDKLDLGGVRVQAHIFQQLIEPAYELRVAVVGKETFAAKVWDKTEAEALALGIRDWRRSVETDTFAAAAYRLPPEVAASCVRYIQLMDLVSGYFDLIVDKKGVYWFLECNPNGQWAFVDDRTVENIGRALARLLESGTVQR